jgi:transposase InsO family protein
MSGIGNCYDNAMVESWFSTLKRELSETFGDEACARPSLFGYIEEYDNRTRAHSSLGFYSPSDFEN